MTKIPFSLNQFKGVDATSDPYLLGLRDPEIASMAHNFRSRRGGARTLRGGYREVSDGSQLKKSGIYFPRAAEIIFPYPLIPYEFSNSGMLVNGGSTCTVEFWYKQSYEPYTRVIGYNPFISTGGYSHILVSMYPVEPDTSTDPGVQRTGVRFEFLTTDGVGGSISGNAFVYENVPSDNEWHHIAIARQNITTINIYIDAVDVGDMTAVYVDPGGHNNFPNKYEVVETPTGQNVNVNPLFGNCYVVGHDNGSIAEYRIWSTMRSLQSIERDKDIALVGDESGLVFYAPLDEADGVRPVERVHNAQGYFSPSEPYVNDSNELVFNGWDSLAIPSMSSSFSPSLFAQYRSKTTDAHYLNEDGSCHGGILWDRCLYNTTGDQDYTQISTDTMDAYDAEGMGIYKGVAQIRLKLQQLSEGVIAGRLGLVWDGTNETYQLFFCNTTHGTTFRCTAGDGHDVNKSWLNQAKTITIFYDGDGSNGGAGDVEIYVDNTKATVTPGTFYWNDHTNGTYPIASGTYPCFTDNLDLDDNTTDGAIGGAISYPLSGIAFDLIFFRQWWDDHAYETNAELVSDTWDQDDLPPETRVYRERMSGEITGFAFNQIEMPDLAGVEIPDVYSGRKFFTIPINRGLVSSDDGLEVSGGTEMACGGHMVRRGIEWGSSSAHLDIKFIPDVTKFIEHRNANLTSCFPAGCVASNLVNDFNYKSFRDNESERLIFTDSEIGDGGSYFTGHARGVRLSGVIEDDSPLQGSMRLGGQYFKTRYLELNGAASSGLSGHSIYEQRSLKPRWCTGPIDMISDYPIIQNICRYTTEKGDITKLLVTANSQVWELDADAGTLTELDQAWLDSDITKTINYAAINNRGVFMGDSSGIKINYLGKFSRLGLERPVYYDFQRMIRGGTDPGIAEDDAQVGYTAQFYDKENDVYSGTLPVFYDNQMSIYYENTSTSTEFVGNTWMYFRGINEKGIKGFRLYKTLDMNTSGSEGVLHCSCDTECPDWYTSFRLADDTQTDILPSERVLPQTEIGQSLIPPNSSAMGIGYGRLFFIGLEKYQAAIGWSDVDALGFARPDQVPINNYAILEAGSISEGTALQEYNGILFAFKSDSIFKIVPVGTGIFGAQVIYKGVGALNGNCVKVAGNSMYFMDTNGIYVYTEGEPVLASPGFVDYFSDELNQDELEEKAFSLHHKKEDLLIFFVPSANSSYCDRCIVLDLRTGVLTLDTVPQCTCGYVDDDTVYLGTPYGKVLKYDPNTYVDVVDGVYTGTCTISSDGDTLENMADSLAMDDSLLGAPVYVVDTSNRRVWLGNCVSEDATDEITVDAWTCLFNDNGTDPDGTVTYYIGHIFGHEKTPILTLSSLKVPNPMWLRNLKEIEYLSAGFEDVDAMMVNATMNNGMDNFTADVTSTTREAKTDLTEGMHKNFQVEYGLFTDAEFTMRGVTYYVSQQRGRYNG